MCHIGGLIVRWDICADTFHKSYKMQTTNMSDVQVSEIDASIGDSLELSSH